MKYDVYIGSKDECIASEGRRVAKNISRPAIQLVIEKHALRDADMKHMTNKVLAGDYVNISNQEVLWIEEAMGD